MIDVRLEGEKMTSEYEAHRHIKKRMDFPNNYGMNQDALWDALLAIDKPTGITLYDQDVMLDALGDYGYELLKLFKDAPRANHDLYFEAF